MEDNRKSGQYFIAYKGRELKFNNIVRALREICPNDFITKKETIGSEGVIFAKNVYNEYIEDRDPYYYSDSGILSVNGYDQNEFVQANRIFDDYRIDDSDRLHRLTNYLYKDYREKLFRKLKSTHFCSVIWDEKSKQLVAGVTEPDSEYNHLYYGYTPKNHEIIISNNEEVLEEFCEEVIELPENTYIMNDAVYTINGEIYDKKKPLIKKSKENASSLIDAVNSLIMQITDDAVREKIKGVVNEYFSSKDPKKQVDDFLKNELDAETKKQVLQLIKTIIEQLKIEPEVEEKLTGKFNEIVKEYAEQVKAPITHVVKLNDTVLGQTQNGFYHERFEQILRQVQLDEPIMLIGPAGSGKNVAISQVAEALGLKMYYTNNASNEFKLTGFIDAGGSYRETEFYKAFKNGGIFFLDEIDNSDPSALIVINSALANGYMAFPHETIDRHPDFRILAAANTWGKGADLQYVGRTALDGATLDRFDNIFFDYDKKLEEALYPSEEVLKFMWAFRDAVYQSKISHIVSTRGIGKVYKKDINGLPVEDILTSNVIKHLRQDDVNAILGNIHDLSDDNKYYDGIKRLKLGR